jgi:hypothetical protein
VRVAAITSYAFLKLIRREMIDQLSENRASEVHATFSATAGEAAEPGSGCEFARKISKSKNPTLPLFL